MRIYSYLKFRRFYHSVFAIYQNFTSIISLSASIEFTLLVLLGLYSDRVNFVVPHLTFKVFNFSSFQALLLKSRTRTSRVFTSTELAISNLLLWFYVCWFTTPILVLFWNNLDLCTYVWGGSNLMSQKKTITFDTIVLYSDV